MGNPRQIETNIQFASMRQIHAAIEHHHRGDFECAITLAGAGEGMLPDAEEANFRQKVKELAVAAEIKIPGGATGPDDYINWLKHGRLIKGNPGSENAIIPEIEVLAVIWRAITKFRITYPEVRTPQMLSFENWMRLHLQEDENSS
jgi:hypothetical protein